MRVLSLFDGIAAGRVALERVGIPIEVYYASEIDEYAIKCAQTNYPDIIELGDITKVSVDSVKLPIDIIFGGSPCQGLSCAGKHLGLEDPRSRLFFEFVRILKEVKPKYFLLENVASMKVTDRDFISEQLGIQPIRLNSNLLSAQNRDRLYWTNIPNIKKPKHKGLFFKDIKEHNAADEFYYTDKAFAWIDRHTQKTGKHLRLIKDEDKVQMIEATHHKKYSSQRFFGIQDTKGLRYITPLECERAQTFPDNYTSMLSSSRRYMTIGNSWTVDIIAHIFSFIPKEDYVIQDRTTVL